jgi:O-antigen/teichoic acid export membrane protein
VSIIRRVAKNAAVLFASYAINAILGMVVTISIARALGAETLGQYSFTLTFTAIFSLFIGLGFPTLIIREVARKNELAAKYLGNVAIITAVLSVVVFAVMAVLVRLLGYPSDTATAVLIFGVYTAATCLADLFRVSFRAFEKMEYEALLSVIVKLVTVSSSLVFIFNGQGIIQIALCFALGGTLDVALCAFVWRWKFTKLRFEVDWAFWKTSLKAAVPLGSLGLMTMLMTRLDTVLLNTIRGETATGLFNAAYSPILAVEPVAFIVYTALLPRMSVYFQSSVATLKVICERGMRYALAVGLPLATGMALLAGPIIRLLFGTKFTASADALRILAWHLPLYFLGCILQAALLATNMHNRMLLVTCVCTAISAALNFLLMPSLGYIGAAIVALTTQAVLSGLYLYALSKAIGVRIPFAGAARPLIACVAMAIFLHVFRGMSLFGMIAGGATLYFVVLLLSGGIDREDRNLIRQLLFWRHQQTDADPGELP